MNRVLMTLSIAKSWFLSGAFVMGAGALLILTMCAVFVMEALAVLALLTIDACQSADATMIRYMRIGATKTCSGESRAFQTLLRWHGHFTD